MSEAMKLAKARRMAASGEGRSIRQSAGLSLLDVAREVGSHEATVQRWETGTRSPHGEAAARWVDLLEKLRRSTRRALAAAANGETDSPEGGEL